MFSGLERPSHWVILALVVLVLFGYKKLPDITRSVGKSLRIFKTEMKGLTDDDDARQAGATSAGGQTATQAAAEPSVAPQPVAPTQPAAPPQTTAQPQAAAQPTAPAQPEPSAAAATPQPVAPQPVAAQPVAGQPADGYPATPVNPTSPYAGGVTEPTAAVDQPRPTSIGE